MVPAVERLALAQEQAPATVKVQEQALAMVLEQAPEKFIISHVQ